MFKVDPIEPLNIELLNIDCMEYMATQPDNAFDLAIVDPPYGIGMGGGKWGNSKVDFKNFAGDDNCIPSEGYFKELMRVSKNYIVWGGNYMTEYLPPKPCFIVWDKVQPENFTMAMAELAITSFDSPAKIYKKRIVGADKGGKIHPTQKPVKLYEWLLKNYAEPNQKILDTHLGSGSIAIAIHNMNTIEKMNLEFVACELDKDYYNSAMERINKHTNHLTIF